MVDPLGAEHAGAPSLVKQLQGEEMLKMLFDYAPGDLQSGTGSFDVTVHKKGSSDVRKASVPMVMVQK